MTAHDHPTREPTSRKRHAELARALADAERRYEARHPQSARRHADATQHLPGGNTRTVLYYSPFPLTWAGGKGNRLTDIDGHEYLDLLGEYSAGLYGHSNPIIQAALKQAIDDGLSLGGPNRYEAALAAAIRARFSSIDLVRFTNSGTEANLMALSAARALQSGRSRVMAFEGAYHGGVFHFRHGGSRLNVPFDWLVSEYNEAGRARTLIRHHAHEIAAVIVEPMLGGGCIPGSREFLATLRAECSARDIVLIFDEVMTSRLSPSGLQGLLGIKPDLTTLGKYLGGGASFGAFGGRRDLLERFDPTRPDSFEHAGTFNNNVLSMAGGLAGLTQVFTPAEAVRLNTLGDALRERLNQVSTMRGACLVATGLGSLIGLHFGSPAAGRSADFASESTQRAVETLFQLDLLERGYYFARRGYIALSLPTSQADCNGFAAAVDDCLAERGQLFEVALG
ncbi:MAG: aminotransferase class III-fold pyridoxal phosphate-dependent enzyme [Steroidobacteraceae bacterium]|jgi:glutamate-1-semialdehyde 2,1-aminomutase